MDCITTSLILYDKEKGKEGMDMSYKVLLGNVLGPQGEQGKTGEQGEQGTKGIRGTRWTDGNLITGTSTEPTAYPTGIIDALPEDYYLNSDTGNIYRCTLGGEDDVALWVFVGNIKGAMPDVENVFTSTSKKNALSANAGRVLYEKISAAGIFPRELALESDSPIYALQIIMENKSTSISITDANGNTGLYTYTKSDSDETTQVSIWVGTAIGLSSGTVLRKLKSTNAGILAYELKDANNQVVESYASDVWEALTELINDHTKAMQLTEEYKEESATYDAYAFSKLVNGKRKTAFPITHAKAIWWNKLQNKTLYDKVMEGLFDSEQIICDEDVLQELDESTQGTLVPDAYLMGQLMSYVYSLPVIRTGTEEPDDSVGKDGDIYIMLESDGE